MTRERLLQPALQMAEHYQPAPSALPAGPAQGSRALLPGPTWEGGVVPGSRMERKRQRQSRASLVGPEANPSASCRKSKFDFPTNPSTQMKVLIELMNIDMKSTP